MEVSRRSGRDEPSISDGCVQHQRGTVGLEVIDTLMGIGRQRWPAMIDDRVGVLCLVARRLDGGVTVRSLMRRQR